MFENQKMSENDLNKLINEIKVDLLKMFYHSKTGHMASAFSCLDILVAIYETKAAEEPCILSKGHGAASLYAILAKKGLIERSELGTYYDMNSRLLALSSPTLPGIPIPTGSLGQGVCYATGLALAKKLDKKDELVFCVLGDGEMQEGSVWEAVMFAASHQLSNLVVILDHNHIQASHYVEAISIDANIEERWKSFQWNVISADGHNPWKLCSIFNEVRGAVKNNTKPTVILAETVKGNGITFLQGMDDCHMKNPKGNQWNEICDQFGITVEELSNI